MKGYERHLRAAVLLEQKRNFGRAADAFGISQPAFSVMISDLEQRLGVPLFHRTTRMVEPTDYARAFLNDVSRTLEALDAAMRSIDDVKALKRGKVVVSCLSSISARLMPPVLHHCWASYPNLEIQIQDEVATRCLDALKEGMVDMTVTAALPLLPEFESEPLMSDPIYVAFEKAHHFAALEKVPWNLLDGEPIVFLSTQSATHVMITQELERHGVTPSRRIDASHLVTIHGMVAAGIGVSILPRLALPVHRSETMLARPLVEPDLARMIRVNWRRDRQVTPAGAAFLDALRAVVPDMA